MNPAPPGAAGGGIENMDEDTEKREDADLDTLIAHYRQAGLSPREALNQAEKMRLQAHLDTIKESENPDPALIKRAAREYATLYTSGVKMPCEDDDVPRCVRDVLDTAKRTSFKLDVTPEWERASEIERRKAHRANWERRRRLHRPDNVPLDVGIWDIAQSLRDISYWLMFVAQKPVKTDDKTKTRTYGKKDFNNTNNKTEDNGK